jgi:2'-5' RNA ligase
MSRRERGDGRPRRGGRIEPAAGVAARGVRSFVAVLLPEALRARVDAAAAELRRLGGAVSWVRVENFHLTLRFLGSVDEATLGRVREALEDAAAGTAPFTVTLGGFGGFPTARAPRVVWVGVETGADALAALHARVEAALARRGIPPEGRPFHGHLTLGRARDPRGGAALGDALETRRESFGEAPVDAVCLMRSDLHPTGAHHSILARVPLAGVPPRADAR